MLTIIYSGKFIQFAGKTPIISQALMDAIALRAYFAIATELPYADSLSIR
ncbi:MAG TPA: hypothetical protein V6C90_02045 [Coleofasciculaceae cyanobacterium]|jgi:hypothetical protein